MITGTLHFINWSRHESQERLRELRQQYPLTHGFSSQGETFTPPVLKSKGFTDGCEIIIEPEFLFEDQMSVERKDSKASVRLMDMAYYYTTKEIFGYWVVSPQLAKAREIRHVCSYCGFQTDTPEAVNGWCPKCIGSPHLKITELPALKLQSIEAKRQRRIQLRQDPNSKEPPVVLPDHILEEFAIAQQKRRMRLIERDAEEMLADIEKAKRKFEVHRWCLLNGMDTDNVIYFHHTNTVEIGWRNKLSEAEAEDMKIRLKEMVNNPQYPFSMTGIKDTKFSINRLLVPEL